jgi:ABC-2 type transport system ATP-binding protein
MSDLRFDGVTKYFGDVVAAHDLSFEVPSGKVFALLGRNGAGKTTSIRMILDIVQPSAGVITVLGERPGRANRRMIGFVPEERGLYSRMTAVESLSYFGRLKGMQKAEALSSAMRLIGQLELDRHKHDRIESLSKGTAQKVQLAAAIINNPRLLILDEPFSGLDPVSQGVLESAIRTLSAAGTTIILSTHVMQHAERLCDSLLILARGRRIFEGNRAEASALLPAQYSVTAQQDPRKLSVVRDAAARESDAEGWTRWEVELKAGAHGQDLLRACFAEGLTLKAYEELQPTLHEVFVHLTGDQVREQVA